MLIIVIENPIQLTIVSAVPINCVGAFLATNVENSGESAITTMPQSTRKEIKSRGELSEKDQGEMIQQQQDKKRALYATFRMPINSAK